MSGVIDLHIGGKLRTLRFNLWQKEALGKLYSVDPVNTQDITKVWGDSLITMATDLAYTGLVGDCRLRRVPVDFTIQDVSEWIGNSTNETAAAIISAWSETEEIRTLIEQVASDNAVESKKKGHGPKSKISR